MMLLSDVWVTCIVWASGFVMVELPETTVGTWGIAQAVELKRKSVAMMRLMIFNRVFFIADLLLYIEIAGAIPRGCPERENQGHFPD